MVHVYIKIISRPFPCMPTVDLVLARWNQIFDHVWGHLREINDVVSSYHCAATRSGRKPLNKIKTCNKVN
jgi:hypothetical protein